MISGSLHWELLLLNSGIGPDLSFNNSDYSFIPSVNRALTDTGTEKLGMPNEDFQKFM